MKNKASVIFEIPFHDVDSLNIAWHGHYYKYFELARTELYRSKGFDIHDMQEMGYIFPVIESHCKYIKPLLYGQKVEVVASFQAWDYYIQIAYQIHDLETQDKCSKGYTKQAACLPSGELQLNIPQCVLDAIQV